MSYIIWYEVICGEGETISNRDSDVSSGELLAPKRYDPQRATLGLVEGRERRGLGGSALWGSGDYLSCLVMSRY